MSASGLNVAAVLLAAGLSRRMGERNKLLIEIDGEPLVRRTAKTYLAAGANVHAVLGHEAGEVRAALADLPLTFVENPRFAEGQPTSVRAGLDSLTGDYDAILIALADQAALTAEDIADLLQAFADAGGGRILIPYYGDRRGNPVVFPAGLIAEVRASGRNAACRSFIDGNPQLTLRYEAGSDRFATDIDTPEDLAAFESGQTLEPIERNGVAGIAS
ncbi:MAG: NTP transferase domain-containing protein [Rhodomicrobium sp.]